MARNLKNIKATALASVITSVASGVKITTITYTESECPNCTTTTTTTLPPA